MVSSAPGIHHGSALLAAAIHRGSLRFGRRTRVSDRAGTLHQMAVYLNQLPGRKNILWGSGGSTAFLLGGDLGPLDMMAVTREHAGLYDGWRRAASRSIRLMREG